MLAKEINRMVSDGKSKANILNAFIYWYDVKKNNPALAHGRLGILDYNWQECMNFVKKYREANGSWEEAEIEEEPPVDEVHVKLRPIKKPIHVPMYKMI